MCVSVTCESSPPLWKTRARCHDLVGSLVTPEGGVYDLRSYKSTIIAGKSFISSTASRPEGLQRIDSRSPSTYFSEHIHIATPSEVQSAVSLEHLSTIYIPYAYQGYDGLYDIDAAAVEQSAYDEDEQILYAAGKTFPL